MRLEGLVSLDVPCVPFFVVSPSLSGTGVSVLGTGVVSPTCLLLFPSLLNQMPRCDAGSAGDAMRHGLRTSLSAQRRARKACVRARLRGLFVCPVRESRVSLVSLCLKTICSVCCAWLARNCKRAERGKVCAGRAQGRLSRLSLAFCQSPRSCCDAGSHLFPCLPVLLGRRHRLCTRQARPVVLRCVGAPMQRARLPGSSPRSDARCWDAGSGVAVCLRVACAQAYLFFYSCCFIFLYLVFIPFSSCFTFSLYFS